MIFARVIKVENALIAVALLHKSGLKVGKDAGQLSGDQRHKTIR